MGNRFADRLMMGNADSKTRTDEDCYGDGLYNYCLGLCGAAGWVFGSSMQGHWLIWLVTKKKHFWYKYSPGADGDGEDKKPWGFLSFFFSFFLSNIPHRKRLFFIWCDRSRRPYILLFSSFSRGAVVFTLPYHDILRASKKRDRVSTITWLHFTSSSFSPFLSRQIFPIFFIFFFWVVVATRGSESPKKKCIAYIPRRAHLSYFFGVYLSYWWFGEDFSQSKGGKR